MSHQLAGALRAQAEALEAQAAALRILADAAEDDRAEAPAAAYLGLLEAAALTGLGRRRIAQAARSGASSR